MTWGGAIQKLAGRGWNWSSRIEWHQYKEEQSSHDSTFGIFALEGRRTRSRNETSICLALSTATSVDLPLSCKRSHSFALFPGTSRTPKLPKALHHLRNPTRGFLDFCQLKTRPKRILRLGLEWKDWSRTRVESGDQVVQRLRAYGILVKLD